MSRCLNSGISDRCSEVWLRGAWLTKDPEMDSEIPFKKNRKSREKKAGLRHSPSIYLEPKWLR